jgi:hypothetical protein
MAIFVTVSNGLVTRLMQMYSSGSPAETIAADPWIDVSNLNPHPVIGDHYDGANFTLDHDALSVAQGVRLAYLRDETATYMMAGFVSTPCVPDKLPPITGYDPGTYFVYGSKKTDQLNVHAAAAGTRASEAALCGLWCAETPTGNVADATNWDVRDHNQMQAEQVCMEMMGHVSNGTWMLRDASARVIAATTVAEACAVELDF